MLFLIPIGGGIPAGVVLAQARGILWPTMMLLYFLSDLVLALVFEPVMLLFVAWARTSPRVRAMMEILREAARQTTAKFGVRPSPLSLVLISFGVDPMTGRSAAKAAGHGFVTGWAIAIAGDMIFFTVLMVSTLFLNEALGDGTWAVIIVTLGILVVPALYRRLREKFFAVKG